ncbi:UNVERIFIED_CONTAM: hypothetical protein FKN15_035729 [Acipenser sinensis]
MLRSTPVQATCSSWLCDCKQPWQRHTAQHLGALPSVLGASAPQCLGLDVHGTLRSSVPQCFSTLGALKPRCLGALSVQVLPNIGGFVSWCSIASLSRCLDILGPLIPLKVFGTSAPVAPDVSEQDVVMSEEEQDALYIAGSWDEESFLWGETQDPDLTQVMVPSSELAFQCPQALFGRLWNESSTSVRFPGRQSLNSAGLHSDQPRL